MIFPSWEQKGSSELVTGSILISTSITQIQVRHQVFHQALTDWSAFLNLKKAVINSKCVNSCIVESPEKEIWQKESALYYKNNDHK